MTRHQWAEWHSPRSKDEWSGRMAVQKPISRPIPACLAVLPSFRYGMTWPNICQPFTSTWHPSKLDFLLTHYTQSVRWLFSYFFSSHPAKPVSVPLLSLSKNPISIISLLLQTELTWPCLTISYFTSCVSSSSSSGIKSSSILWIDYLLCQEMQFLFYEIKNATTFDAKYKICVARVLILVECRVCSERWDMSVLFWPTYTYISTLRRIHYAVSLTLKQVH